MAHAKIRKNFCANTKGKQREVEWDAIVRDTCEAVGCLPPVKEHLLLEGVLPAKGKVEGFPDHWFSPKMGHRRKFKLDYWWPEYRLAVEIDGVSPFGARNRHQDFAGFTLDCVKHNIVNVLGITLLRYTQPLLVQGQFLADMRHLKKEGRFVL